MAKKPIISKEKAEAMRLKAVKTAPDLCKSLAGIAAFHVEDPQARRKIYAAIRSMQIMAGLAPMPPLK